MECRKSIYGISEAGYISKKQPQKSLALHVYASFRLTPGLWQHNTCPITFILVVNNFSIKYVGTEHAENFHRILAYHYEKIEQDWTGELFCGITIYFHYEAVYVDISSIIRIL